MSYYSTIMRDGPTAYYRLGELTGTTAKDSSSNAYNGALTGTVTEGVAGAIIGDPNAAMSFDGSTGYVACPVGLSVTGATLLAVECWLSVPSTSYGSDARIIANSHTDADNNGFQIYINHFTHTPLLVDFQIGNGVSHLSVETVGGPTMTINTWYHFAFVYDTSGVRTYINGTFNNSTASASFGAISSSGFVTNFARNPAYTGDYFQGGLDEVAFYVGKTLSADQIKNHYQAGIDSMIIRPQHPAFVRLQ